MSNSPCVSEKFAGYKIGKFPFLANSEVPWGSTAQFGKKSQTGVLSQFKVWKTKESCMCFRFFKRKKWGKKTAETRRRNCAVLP